MILLSWNCRGLRNPSAFHDLCQLVKEKKPHFLFLMETKSVKNKMEAIRIKLGFTCLFVVDPVGRSGRLAFLWNDGSGVSIKNLSRRHIHVEVLYMAGTWLLTDFYGHPNPMKREEGWNLLQHLKDNSSSPWMCMGDFNEIVAHFEKWGASLRRECQMKKFRDAITYCGVT